MSGANLSVADVPDTLAELTADPTLVTTRIDGRSMLVAGATGRDGADFFFFSIEQIERSLPDRPRPPSVHFSTTSPILAAATVGWFISRRTLKPVAATAAAAEAIAAGDLAARLPDGGTDEFGTLATSFNHMADEVESLIRRLGEAADREHQLTADVAHELRTP